MTGMLYIKLGPWATQLTSKNAPKPWGEPKRDSAPHVPSYARINGEFI